MLLAEPQPTRADLHFRLAGIPVRVSCWFWLTAALLGWGSARGMAGDDGRALLVYLTVWAAVVLVSILVHELGHAVAFASCGQRSRIVLCHFGGLAVPVGLPSPGLQRPSRRLVVAAAGPLAQLAIAGIVIAMILGAGFQLPAGGLLGRLPIIGKELAAASAAGQPLASPLLSLAVFYFLTVNIGWAFLNLLPVVPLDGGTVVQEGLQLLGVSAAAGIAALFGLLIAGIIAVWAFQRQDMFLAIMFAMLASGCYQRLLHVGLR